MRFDVLAIVIGWIVLGMADLSPALAKEQNTKKPMEFTIVRSDSKTCDPDCPEWIAAQGQIVGGSFIALAKVIQSLKGKKLPILIDSSGGDVDTGLKMGRLIREKGLDIGVARTAIEPECETSIPDCKKSRTRPQAKLAIQSSRGAICYSACTFVLAGGVRRVVMPGATVGVHQVTFTQIYRKVYRRFYVERRLVNGRMVEVSRRLISETVISQKQIKLKSAPASTNRQIEVHFQKMGIDPAFFALTMATPADGFYILSRTEVLEQRIGTDIWGPFWSIKPSTANTVVTLPSTSVQPVVFPQVAPLALRDEPKAFVGYLMLDTLSAELTLRPDRSGRSVMGSVRLMEQGKTIPSVNYGLTLDFYESFRVYFSAPQGADPMPPLTARLDRGRLCNLPASSLLTIRLLDGVTAQSKLIGPAGIANLLPLEGIRAALCPR
jgi:hypothetical protein